MILAGLFSSLIVLYMCLMVDLYKGAPKMTVAFPYLIPDASIPSSIC